MRQPLWVAAAFTCIENKPGRSAKTFPILAHNAAHPMRRHFDGTCLILCPSCLKGAVDVVVYLDGVIGLNFLVDLLLLLGVNRLSGHPPELGRTAAAAVLGGGYAGACMVPSLTFLSSGFWRSVSLGLVSMTAFGINRSAIRRCVLFVVLSMAMGGLVVSFDTGNFPGLVICALLLCALCTIGFRGKALSRRLHKVTITHRGKKYQLLALEDTGNTLRDPITGENVLVGGPELAIELTGLTQEQLADPVGALASSGIAGLRLIPYRAVGCDSGMLLGIRCDRIMVGKMRGSSLVAFSPHGFSGGEYQALIGGQYV